MVRREEHNTHDIFAHAPIAITVPGFNISAFKLDQGLFVRLTAHMLEIG